ncbi:hypothetical protein [Prescottella equi]
MTAPAPARPEITDELVEQFREHVGGGDTVTADALRGDLVEAKTLVDNFAQGATAIPAHMFVRWYIAVGAEIFDRRKGPSQFVGQFDTVVAARTTRNPLRVVLAEMRQFIPGW